MILRDGTWKIFVIERRTSGGVWIGPFLDTVGHFYAFGYPPGFSRDGECWQKTRVHGVLDEAQAVTGLHWMEKKYPYERFRIRCVRIEQTSHVLHVQ